MKSGDKLSHPEKGPVVFVGSYGKELAEVRLPSGLLVIVTAALLTVPVAETLKQAAG